MLSNNTVLEIQRLLDGLFFVENGLGVHVQRMPKMSRVYTLAEVLSKLFVKQRRKIGDLINEHGLTNKRFGTNLIFIKIYFAITAFFSQKMLTNKEIVTFQKRDFFDFSLYFYYKLYH